MLGFLGLEGMEKNYKRFYRDTNLGQPFDA